MIVMRSQGKTHRQIAEAFGISIDRVRQLMARTESRARMLATQPNRTGLSVRAQGVLPALIDEPEADRSERDLRLPERVAALTRAQILDVPNAGHRTIAEIEAWLWERDLYLNG
jgi:transposase